jgi:hypothetical protein
MQRKVLYSWREKLSGRRKYIGKEKKTSQEKRKCEIFCLTFLLYFCFLSEKLRT